MSNPSGVPDEVIAFVSAHIRSVEQLEILLLVRESAPRAWSVHEANAVIRSSEESVAAKLRTLAELGLLSRRAPGEDVFAFAPRDAELAACVDRVAETYRDRRTSIIELIYSQPEQTLKSFSDAFLVRKDKKNG